MALMYPRAMEAIRSVRPEALLLLETYSHPEPTQVSDRAAGFGGNAPPWAAACLAQFPEGTLARSAPASVRHGFTGLSIFGESSPFHANAELNYLAFADYGSEANPESDLDSFWERTGAPLLGGAERARRYVELVETVGEPRARGGGGAGCHRRGLSTHRSPSSAVDLAGELPGLLPAMRADGGGRAAGV